MATSAYQIEGACHEDGRGPSIWDRFSHQRGRTRGGATGDCACDHYHRFREDVALMAGLGIQAYRFSIAWTRILPTGSGDLNPHGLDFYDRLVDELLEWGITPYATLFHYDLPQRLQDQGGWPNRNTALRFGEYAQVIGKRFGDRVDHWITHNEPTITATLGYLTGEHAPGQRNPPAAFRALHHILLSHGLAVQALRTAVQGPARIGIAINLTPIYPATPSAQDCRSADLAHMYYGRMVLDPLLKGCYPAELTPAWIWRRLIERVAREGDLETISTPLDFVGVNYYTRAVFRHAPLIGLRPASPRKAERTQMGWEIYSPGLYDLLARLHADYSHSNLIVTENGAAFPDEVSADGQVHDPRRICYLADHVDQVRRAIADGIPVSGYFVWTLLDNFEWALGYTRRFGLVYVDHDTQQRIPKDSYYWYKKVVSGQ